MANNNVKNYQDTFNTESGKKVLADLAQFCGHLSSSYVMNDPQGTAYKEGMRRVFLRILSFINSDEAEIRKLIKQNQGALYD